MLEAILDQARHLAEQAAPAIRAAALLRIARVETASDSTRARATCQQALGELRLLPEPNGEYLLEEARLIAAAVAPDLLPQIDPGVRGPHDEFASGQIVQTMLQHGHIDDAVDFLLHHDADASFPFGYVNSVLHKLDAEHPDTPGRRLLLLHRAVEAWRAGGGPHHQRHFLRFFAQAWKHLPKTEALAITHEVIDRAIQAPDLQTSAGYPDGIHLSSSRQHQLFEILHILRHLDPTLAQSLIDSHDQLATAARRFPNGMETMHQEAEAAVAQRQASGETCTPRGFIFAGDPRDFERERALAEASREGDFTPAIADALEKYQDDIVTNYAPKEYWPSTGHFRSTLYAAGKRLGPEAANLLEQIPDADLRLFARIELAAALAGLPEASITQRRQRAPEARRGRVVLPATPTTESMRSPDGSLIRCPRCAWLPSSDHRWMCKCHHVWNTFWTSGVCPACKHRWTQTQCASCGEMSPHEAWYIRP